VKTVEEAKKLSLSTIILRPRAAQLVWENLEFIMDSCSVGGAARTNPAIGLANRPGFDADRKGRKCLAADGDASRGGLRAASGFIVHAITLRG
jgi:hypothetical protein